MLGRVSVDSDIFLEQSDQRVRAHQWRVTRGRLSTENFQGSGDEI